MTDFNEAEAAEIEGEVREIRGALLNDTMAVLSPVAPICLAESVSVHEAVQAMLERRQAAVVVVDGPGRLTGIFTERDVLMRVVGKGLDARRTPLGSVMTRNPEALTATHRIAYAVHSMSVAGFRTLPLVDAERRPVGIVTVTDVIRWLADRFPEAVLNLPPGDALKHPERIDGG